MKQLRWILPLLMFLGIAAWNYGFGQIQTTAYAHDSSPFEFSPSVTDVDDNGRCIKGKFQCRWGGDCQKHGNKCYSCTEGYKYNHSFGKCYKCSKGHSLQKKNGSWVCVD